MSELEELGIDERDLTDWKVEVQEVLYGVMEDWISETQNAFLILKETRESLSKASLYGSYHDQVQVAKLLEESIVRAADAVLKVSGQFDSPTHLSLSLNQVVQKSALDVKLDGLSSERREKINLVLKAVLDEAKKFVEIPDEYKSSNEGATAIEVSGDSAGWGQGTDPEGSLTGEDGTDTESS